jgi:hypothetical protein
LIRDRNLFLTQRIALILIRSKVDCITIIQLHSSLFVCVRRVDCTNLLGSPVGTVCPELVPTVDFILRNDVYFRGPETNAILNLLSLY